VSIRVVDSNRDSESCVGSFCLDANNSSEETLDSGNAPRVRVISVDSVGGLDKFLGTFTYPIHLSGVLIVGVA